MELKYPLSDEDHDFYLCNIFVDTLFDINALYEKIAMIIGCPITDEGIETSWGDIGIVPNPDHDRHKGEGFADFVSWPFYLEIIFQEEKNITPEQYVNGVNDLIEKMWAAQIRLVVDSLMEPYLISRDKNDMD